MKKLMILILCLVNLSAIYPDWELTPGEVSTRDAKEVCKKGYSKKTRNVPESVKRKVYEAYGLEKSKDCCEVDHFIPLELGGSNSIKNLWPQPYTKPGAHEKDWLENKLHKMVCSGEWSLDEAQDLIRSEWYSTYLELKNKK